jgi:hypothetical protein
MKGAPTRFVRHSLDLPDDLVARLDVLCSKHGPSRSAVIVDALHAVLERRAASDISDRFAVRLERLEREQLALHKKLDLLSEPLSVFIRHELTRACRRPALGSAAARIGRERYLSFIELVGRRLGGRADPPGIAPRRSLRPASSPPLSCREPNASDR